MYLDMAPLALKAPCPRLLVTSSQHCSGTMRVFGARQDEKGSLSCEILVSRGCEGTFGPSLIGLHLTMAPTSSMVDLGNCCIIKVRRRM